MLSQISAALDQLRFDQSVRAVIIRSNVAKVRHRCLHVIRPIDCFGGFPC